MTGAIREAAKDPLTAWGTRAFVSFPSTSATPRGAMQRRVCPREVRGAHSAQRLMRRGQSGTHTLPRGPRSTRASRSRNLSRRETYPASTPVASASSRTPQVPFRSQRARTTRPALAPARVREGRLLGLGSRSAPWASMKRPGSESTSRTLPVVSTKPTPVSMSRLRTSGLRYRAAKMSGMPPPFLAKSCIAVRGSMSRRSRTVRSRARPSGATMRARR